MTTIPLPKHLCAGAPCNCAEPKLALEAHPIPAVAGMGWRVVCLNCGRTGESYQHVGTAMDSWKSDRLRAVK